MDGKYRILYEAIHKPDGMTKEEIPKDKGACDCIVIHSIIGIPNGPGPLSVLTLSLNGIDGSELTPEQQFNIWAMWANRLVEQLPDGGRKNLVKLVDDVIRDAVAMPVLKL